MIKKIFLSFLITLFFTFTLSSCSFINQESDPSTFDDYTNSLLLPLIGEDEFTIHFLFKNPENYGLTESGNISLPTPSTTGALSKILINMIFGNINTYDYEKLNFDQQMTYNVLTDLVDSINNKTTEMSYLDSNYLGSYLGYQAQLPLLLQEYKFYNYNDILNYFKFFEIIPETFEAYVDFEFEKAEKGYGMPDFVIDKVVNQCTEFINNIEEHFLIKTFISRTDGIDTLNLNSQQLYDINYENVTGPMLEGYQYVKDNLPKLYGKATNNLGLAHYDIGKEYYTYLFQNETGYDIEMDEAIKYIDDKLTENYLQLQQIIHDTPNIQEIVKNYSLMTITPEEQIELYKDMLYKDFPVPNDLPNINIKYIDESMENHFSPAAYLSSPIDYLDEQYIFLNNAKIDGDYNYLYSTLAHEAIPGHLYQDYYFKSQDVNILRKILKNKGYSEGWATYAEMYSLSSRNHIVAEYLLNENEFLGALQCRLDMGIHYEGWDVDDVLTFLNKYLTGYTEENAKAILEQIVEIPTNPQIYYFTYFKILDMRESVEETLGLLYTEKIFHKLILDCGPVPLKYVEVVVEEYIQKNKIN